MINMEKLPYPKWRVVLRKAIKNAYYVWHDIRANHLGQLFPLKPRIVNLLVNDICNSKCQMCLIWKQKRDRELSPEELFRILRDPLFQQVVYVGVSGGEPTLRKDLPELYRCITQALPQLRGTGIITNAIREKDVIDRVSQSLAICQDAGVNFNLMVSLDGVGDVHNQVRGRKGNFKSALTVLKYFREHHPEIRTSFGSTITKGNVWNVDELLDFAIENGWYGRFRIAEYILRLYNDDQTAFIRNFTAAERYHLALFFTRLERSFEKNPVYQRTYRNIRSMLLGSQRQIRCHYQTEAVVLESRGRLLYCSPKSPVLGDVAQSSAYQLYRDKIPIRQQIIHTYCDDCIHDYHAEPTIHELVERGQSLWWKTRLKRPARINLKKPALTPHNKVKHAFIIGWYGTETAGDKAILGEIIHKLKQRSVSRISLASLTPFLSQHTVQELGYPEIEVIPVFSAEFLQMATQADETIMGGGPLMDLAVLPVIQQAFACAKQAGKRTWIAGCGIGPLFDSQHIRTVRGILALADRIELRDQASVEWARAAVPEATITHTDDYATGFVKRWKVSYLQPSERSATLNCYLRDWPLEYRADLDRTTFLQRKQAFEAELAEWITHISQTYTLRPRLLAMHYFVNGGDDRVFNRYFAKKYLAVLNPIVEVQPFSPQEILASMQEATLCLTMRFHSTLFANTLGAPFIAIDYTQGGKVHHYMTDHQKTAQLITIAEIAAGKWKTWKMPL